MRVLGSTRSIPALQYVATTQVGTTNMFGVYKWQQDAVGWGTRYPIATFSSETGYDARFSPDNNYIVTTTATTVKMFPFTFNGIGTVVSGGPTKSLSNPNAGLSWHPDQNAVGWGDNRQATAPTMHVTSWTGTSWGTNYSQPATQPGGAVNATRFNDVGDYFFSSDTNDPGIFAYPWTSGSGFGTKKANPATFPALVTTIKTIADEDVVMSQLDSPYVVAYPFISSWGTKYSNPATTPTGSAYDVASSGLGPIVVAHDTSPYVTAYPFTVGVGFGTKYANPSTLPGGLAGGIDFSPDGKNVVVGVVDSPYTTDSVNMWSWSSGWGTKYAAPAQMVASRSYPGNGVVAFSHL